MFRVARRTFVDPAILERRTARNIRQMLAVSRPRIRIARARRFHHSPGRRPQPAVRARRRTSFSALLNTCPHRGAQVCREKHGQRQGVPMFLPRLGVRTRRQAAQLSRQGNLSRRISRRGPGSSMSAGSPPRELSRPAFRLLRREVESLVRLSRRREGISRRHLRPVDGGHADRQRFAGIFDPRQLEVVDREFGRRLSRA